MLLLKITCIIVLYYIVGVHSARILAVFPTPSISHQLPFRPIVKELARRGHEVTVITTDPEFNKGNSPANLTEIDVHDISYKIWREEFFKTVSGEKNAIQNQIITALKIVNTIVEKQVMVKEIEEIIKNKEEKIDLLILEAWVRPILVFSHLYKVPVIQISSFGGVFNAFDIIGASTHPLLYPNPTSQNTVNLTVIEKVKAVYDKYQLESAYFALEEDENAMIRKLFGPDVPNLSDLVNNVDMVFLNNYAIWDNNRPVPPNLVYIGGIHRHPEKEIPKDLKSYLDSSKNGVIYLSFGTNVDPTLLPPEKIQQLVNVLSKMPYDVLWKWNGDDLPGRSKNIKTQKWFPQPDLLRHPNIKLFITQGGLQSTDEAITAGVPMVGVPMLGDQWYNVEQYRRLKIGVRVDMDDLTEERFRNAIETVINDESFRQNINRLREVLYDQQQSPLDRAVWWTEHVLRHGGAEHLRTAGANMPWSTYYELEIVLTLLILLVLAFVALLVFAYYFINILGSVSVKEKSC